MKKYLLPEKGNFYKANLHLHSKVSDGENTPEQIKDYYMAHGYSIVAYTDHDTFVTHNDLTDDNFIALNGFEIEINEPVAWPVAKTCHICYVATDPEMTEYPFAEYKRVYSPECISNAMKIGRDKGFFVTYNHPVWSRENYEQYTKYENMHAMEIYNHESYIGNPSDYCPMIYDDMLGVGKRIFALATDDSHAHWTSCGGFVMIKAEKLEYTAITDALLRGDFYASRGPEIYSVWYDDEEKTINIKTSKAASINANTGIRRSFHKHAKYKKLDCVTDASFVLNGNEKYVRFTVTDENGLTAETNAFFLDTFMDQ